MFKTSCLRGAGAGALALAAAAAAPAFAHHSFGMFDGSVTRVFTGVVVRVSPDANHLQIFFAPMNEERTNVLRDEAGEPVVWAVEMAGSAASAEQGISVNTFPRGTIFSVGLHPLRNGDPAGNREGALIKCPERVDAESGKTKSVPPAASMHCDSVEGHLVLGQGALPAPTEGGAPPADETAAAPDAAEAAEGTDASGE
jgi:hypothetical protein